jgi:cyclomaltodextrinase / maltogenic alpha-amylase / neopullulanase
LKLYPWEAAQVQLNLLDSHDMPRFLSLSRGDKSALRLATLYQMTYPGAPCIYYGDEIGMTGGRDPDCRRSFPWDDSAWDKELLAYFKHCIALRKAHPALRQGEYISLSAGENSYAYLRRLGDSVFIIALNTSNQPEKLTIPCGSHLPEGSHLTGLLFSGEATVQAGSLACSLPARTGNVFRLG